MPLRGSPRDATLHRAVRQRFTVEEDELAAGLDPLAATTRAHVGAQLVAELELLSDGDFEGGQGAGPARDRWDADVEPGTEALPSVVADNGDQNQGDLDRGPAVGVEQDHGPAPLRPAVEGGHGGLLDEDLVADRQQDGGDAGPDLRLSAYGQRGSGRGVPQLSGGAARDSPGEEPDVVVEVDDRPFRGHRHPVGIGGGRRPRLELDHGRSEPLVRELPRRDRDPDRLGVAVWGGRDAGGGDGKGRGGGDREADCECQASSNLHRPLRLPGSMGPKRMEPMFVRLGSGKSKRAVASHRWRVQ